MAEQERRRAAQSAARRAHEMLVAKNAINKKAVKGLVDKASVMNQSYRRLKLVVEQNFTDFTKLLRTVSPPIYLGPEWVGSHFDWNFW